MKSLKKHLLISIGIIITNIISITYANTDNRICTMEYMPVCGVDGQTYSNECYANRENIEIDYDGECIQDTLIQAITRGAQTNITRYNTVETFRPDDFLTREQAAKMIIAALDAMSIERINNNTNICSRSDQETIDPTLGDYVIQSCHEGLFYGTQEGLFVPDQALTYEQLHIVLQRVVDMHPSLQNTLPYFARTAEGMTRGIFIKILYTIQNNHNTQTPLPTTPIPTVSHTQTQEKLNQAQELWGSYDFTNYDLIQSISCFCLIDYTRPIAYTIDNGVVNTGSIIYQETQEIPKIEIPARTIKQAFAIIQEAIDTNAAAIVVSYDPTYGYPTMISIDQSSMIADEEEYYEYELIIDTNETTALQGKRQLISIDTVDQSNYNIHMVIDVDTIATRICNNLASTYTLTENQELRLGGMRSTKMMCDDTTLMEIETIIGNIQYPSYTITEGQTILTIQENGNTIIFERVT